MALTTEQETYLAAFADAGIAEELDAVKRNEDIAKALIDDAARETKRAELELQAKTLVETGMEEFEASLDKG